MYEIRKGREEMQRLRRDGEGGDDDKFCAMTAGPGSLPNPADEEDKKKYDCTDQKSPDYPCTGRNQSELDRETVLSSF